MVSSPRLSVTSTQMLGSMEMEYDPYTMNFLVLTATNPDPSFVGRTSQENQSAVEEYRHDKNTVLTFLA